MIYNLGLKHLTYVILAIDSYLANWLTYKVPLGSTVPHGSATLLVILNDWLKSNHTLPALQYPPFEGKHWSWTKFSLYLVPEIHFSYDWLRVRVRRTSQNKDHMCPFNANQTCRSDPPLVACLLCLAVRRAMKYGSGGGKGDAVEIISGFEGINPRSLPLEWPQLTPGMPRHNKRAKGVKASEGREFKTEPATCAATANLGFSFMVSSPSFLCGQIMSFPALSLRQQTPMCCSSCDIKTFALVDVQEF